MSIKKVVKHGQQVRKGDVVVELDFDGIDKAIADLEHAISLEKISLDQARFKLDMLKRTTRIDLEDARLANRIAQEEIFGPVLAVQTFRTVAEVIQKANNTPFGLSAGVWTDKGSKIFNMTSQMRAGVVWANTFNKFDPSSPFGGYKESGFGREGGMHGLAAYLK